MRKIFTFMMALVLGAGMLYAESGTCGDHLYWNLTNGVLTISGTGDMYNYKGGSSSHGTPWYEYRNSIKSIQVGNSVTSIGDYAFAVYGEVTSVTLGKGLKRIGICAFQQCDKLTTPLVFSEDLERIEESAFTACKKVPSITLNDKLKYIGVAAFFGMDSIKSVVIPDNVDTIEMKAFDRCSNLKTMTIGENVQYISPAAFHFYATSQLKSIVWNVKNYKHAAQGFFQNDYITSFVFGENVEYIPEELCAGMNKLTSITIPASVKKAGKNVFKDCSRLTSVVWNAKHFNNATVADEAPFYAIRQNITSFVIGDKVEYIPSYFCYEMTKLPEVTIPASVTQIDNHAFDGCTKITDIVVPNDVTTLGEYAFANCGLTSATIGNNVSSIGKYAFMGNESMSAVYNEAVTPQTITANVFSDVNLPGCDLYVPESSITAYKNANIWKTFKSFTPICRLGSGTDGGINWYHSCSGHLSISGTGAMPDYTRVESIPTAPWRAGGAAQDHTILSAEVSDGITNIGDNAFYNCRDMAQVYIPNSVTKIGKSSFYGCQVLEAVTLSDNITSIGWNAFNQCSALTTITLPVHLTSIEGQAFFMCSGLTSVVIPNEVTSIGEDAFGYCSSLKSVVIPASVTSIGDRAFASDTKLEAIRNDAMTPQTINANVFGNVDKSNCTLIVPKNAVSAYLTAPVWKEFNILTEENVIASGICGAQGDNLTWTLTTDGLLTISGTGEMGWAVVGQAPWDTWKNSILSVVIGNGVTSIASFAFLQCEALSQIEIPSTVTTIADGAFTQCYGLSEITIPANVTNIGNYTFLQCSSLTSITIPEGITNIGTCAFQDCTGLTSITIPASVETIGVSAFANCSGLKSVTNKRQVPQTIEASVFGNLDLSKIYLFVEPDVVDDYKAAAVWKDFNPIVPIGTPMSINEITNDNYQISNKVIRDGHLYIIRDGKTYSVTGQMVK